MSVGTELTGNSILTNVNRILASSQFAAIADTSTGRTRYTRASSGSLSILELRCASFAAEDKFYMTRELEH